MLNTLKVLYIEDDKNTRDALSYYLKKRTGKLIIAGMGTDALEQYIEGSRKLIIPKEGHEDALFYSMQRRRIGVQAVQNLVKKYAKEVTPLKKITPHKLRSTYGTALYQETDDIYLVAEVLGHSDVNTTRKHYAAMSDTRRRQAAGKVVLRESVSHDSEDSNS